MSLVYIDWKKLGGDKHYVPPTTSRREALAVEGDLRRRSVRQRRAFEKHSLDDAMFFANATSMTLESLRLGPKWAFRARQPLRTALAS